MKPLFFIAFLFLGVMPGIAQECAKMYDYFKEGVQLEYTHYDKKGKIESVNTQHVIGIENRKDTLVATFEVTSVDDQGKEVFRNTFPIKCHEGTVYMDMRGVVPPQQNQEGAPDMKIEVRGTDQTFPPDMKPGQILPDAEMEITIRMGDIQLMTTKYTIKNRKVEVAEVITTVVGTYKCLIISYDFEYKLMGTRSIHTLYWYSQAVGMLKSVSYDKKGNEESRIELTKFVQ